MPWTITVALSFALFKTYAIPTISAVLTKSGQLSSAESAGRRAEGESLSAPALTERHVHLHQRDVRRWRVPAECGH